MPLKLRMNKTPNTTNLISNSGGIYPETGMIMPGSQSNAAANVPQQYILTNPHHYMTPPGYMYNHYAAYAAQQAYPIPMYPTTYPYQSGVYTNVGYSIRLPNSASTYQSLPSSTSLASNQVNVQTNQPTQITNAAVISKPAILINQQLKPEGNFQSTKTTSTTTMLQASNLNVLQSSQQPRTQDPFHNLAKVKRTSQTNTLTFDQEKFKKDLLNNNGREDGWHLFLFEDDRKQVENILKEAIEFEIHYANFEREFMKMSQTTTTIGDGTLMTYSSMWNNWKDNLLNRWQQTSQLQEKTLDKFYQKICQDYPLFVIKQGVGKTDKPISTINDQLSLTSTSVILGKSDQQSSESKNQSSVQLQISDSGKTNNKPLYSPQFPKQPDSSIDKQSQLPVQTTYQSQNGNSQKFDDQTCSTDIIPTKKQQQAYVDTNKNTEVDPKNMQIIQKALEHQEKIRKTNSLIFENPEFTKSLNDFAFLRNEISFIDQIITRIQTFKQDRFEKNKNLKEMDTSKKQQSIKPLSVVNSKSNSVNQKQYKSTKSDVDSSPKLIDTTSKLNDVVFSTFQQDTPKLSISSTTSKQPEQLHRAIQIQITKPEQRKVIESRNNNNNSNKNNKDNIVDPTTIVNVNTNHHDSIMSIQASSMLMNNNVINSKDLPRTNNIQVPIVRDNYGRNSKKNRDLLRNNKKSLLGPSLEQGHREYQQSESTQQQQSSHFESTYFDPSLSSIRDYPRDQPPSRSDHHVLSSDINMFIERERQSLEVDVPPESLKPACYTDPRFFTVPRKYTEEPLYIKDLLDFPARSYRPTRIVFIIRGLPGSGKTHLAKLIKEKEEQNNSLVKSRLLSLDDYFMVERDDLDSEDSCRGKNSRPAPPIMVYEFDPEKESQYKFHLFKEFRRITCQGYYNFVILDSVNSTINDVRNYYVCAIENNYIPYVIEMEAIIRRLLNDCIDGEEIVAHCYKHNRHGRSLAEIRALYEQWELLPVDYLRVDAYQLMSGDNNKNRHDGNSAGILSLTRRIGDEENLNQVSRGNWSQQSSMSSSTGRPSGRWANDSDYYQSHYSVASPLSPHSSPPSTATRPSLARYHEEDNESSYSKKTRYDQYDELPTKRREIVDHNNHSVRWAEPKYPVKIRNDSYTSSSSYYYPPSCDKRYY